MEMTNNNVDQSLANNKMSFNLQDSRTYLTSDPERPTWWQRRTRMERRMVLGVTLVSFICFAFIIALVVLATKARTEEEFKNLIRSLNVNPLSRQPANVCTTPGCLDAASQIIQSMDTQVNPCDDFYRFSCGNWIQRHTIPDDKSSVNLFSQATDNLMMQLRNVIEKPKQDDECRAVHTTKDIYAACMNVDVADTRGLDSFQSWVNDMGGWPVATDNWDASGFDWQRVNLQFMRESSDYLISANPGADIKNNSHKILYVSIAGPQLEPTYLLSKRRYPSIINAYRSKIKTVIQVVSGAGNGLEINETDIDEILRLETMLANVTNSALLKVGLENLDALYNKLTIREINELSKWKFDWLSFLNELYADVRPISEYDMAIVSLPTTLADFFDSFEQFDDRAKANYLMWRFASSYIWHINDQTRRAWFEYDRVVSGQQVQPARWLACVSIINNLLGEVMGSIYVREFVPPETKPRAEEMVEDIQQTLNIVLDSNEWMDQPTLEKAEIKAAAMMDFVAYPDWYFNSTYLDEMYEDLHASPVDIENYREIMRLTGRYSLEELIEEMDRNEWIVSASTVNAFYSPSRNSIIFPAGILQPPFFAPNHLRAMNYGGIGSVIGHEVTHAFDNEGRQNDENGNLLDWWTEQSAQAYQTRASCIRNQYAGYCSEDLRVALNLTKTPCVDGNNTLSENIADNGGLKIAFQAYQARTRRDGDEPKLPGLGKYTAEQLFFISFAQNWCGISRPQKQFQNLLYDVHSPDYFRVRGVLSNSEDFARAFQCPPNSTMNPTTKCAFW